MKNCKLKVFTAFLLLALALQSCKDYSKEKVWAQAEWNRHRLVVREYINGQRENMEEFENSLIFFDSLHEITGIDVRANISGALGLVFFNDETIADMEKIDIWYKENKERIVWDSELGKVTLLK